MFSVASRIAGSRLVLHPFATIPKIRCSKERNRRLSDVLHRIATLPNRAKALLAFAARVVLSVLLDLLAMIFASLVLAVASSEGKRYA